MAEHSKVYLVIADTWEYAYGSEMWVFMATMNLELAQAELERVKEEQSRAEIIVMDKDVSDKTYLGGYHE